MENETDVEDVAAVTEDLAAPPAEQEAAATLVDAPVKEDAPEVKPAWPDDWREKLAGGDEKFLNKLGRYRSPDTFAKSYKDLQQKVTELTDRAKSAPEKPGEGATEEDIAAYRKAAGIPDAPEGYIEALPDGLVIGDEDKEAISVFLKDMHDGNAPPEHVHRALSWWNQHKEALATKQVEADRASMSETEEELRTEWGREYTANLNAMRAFLASAPTDAEGNSLKDMLMSARLPNGRLLGNDATALRWMVDLAMQANPAATIAPGDRGKSAADIDAELKSIEKKMGTPKYTDADAARWKELTEAKAKLAS